MRLKHLKRITDGLVDLLVRKNRDYGSDNISHTGLPGIAVRLMDKVYRLQNLTTRTDSPNFEGVRDTLMDIANYALIGLMVEDGSWGLRDTSPMVYVAGPIDASKDHTWVNWLDNEFRTLGINAYFPQKAFAFNGVSNAAANEIQRINRTVLSGCDIMIAYLPDGIPTVGTYREIEYAVSRGINAIVVPNGWQERSLTHVELRDTYICATLTEAVAVAMSLVNSL